MPRKRTANSDTPKARQLLSRHFLEKQVALLQPPAALVVAPGLGTDRLAAQVVEHISRCALVGERGRIEGIVTERDLALKHLSRSESATAAACMTRDPQSVPPFASIARVLYNMAVGGFRHVPVLHKDGTPPGMLAVTGLVDFIYRDMVEP